MVKQRCCIPGCKSTVLSMKLYKFPCQKQLSEAWENILRKMYPNVKLTRGLNGRCQQWCCRLHFEPKYLRLDGRRLRFAIPTLFTLSEIDSRKPAQPISMCFYKEKNHPDTSSIHTSNSVTENDHHIFCSYHDHCYGEFKKSKLVFIQELNNDEEMPSTETSMNTTKFQDNNTFNESLDEVEQESSPTIETWEDLQDNKQIKRIVEDNCIDHNIYIPEVVDTIPPEQEPDIMHKPPSDIIIDKEDFQKDVILCFEQVSTMGLSEHDRNELVNKQLLSSNCMLYGAPILNSEIKAALPQMIIERDQAIEYKQTLLASAIASLVEAIGVVLSSEDNKTDLLQLLVDTGRLLCDCQHNDTITRRNCILDTINKDIKETLTNSKNNKFLFGEVITLPHNLNTADGNYEVDTDITIAPGSETAEAIYQSGPDFTIAPCPETAEAIYQSGPDFTIAPCPETAEAIYQSGPDFTIAPCPETAEAIYQSDPDFTIAPCPETAEAIYQSGPDFTIAPCPETAEEIYRSSPHTMAPGRKTVEQTYQFAPKRIPKKVKNNSKTTLKKRSMFSKKVNVIHHFGTEMSLGPSLRTAEITHQLGAEIIRVHINVPNKRKYPKSYDYNRREDNVIEDDDYYDLGLRSPS